MVNMSCKKNESEGRTNANDDVLGFLRTASDVVLKNALGTTSVTSLSVQGGARVVGNHSISTAKRVLHRTPDMIFWRRLYVPNIA
jgi:hypothetical protein